MIALRREAALRGASSASRTVSRMFLSAVASIRLATAIGLRKTNLRATDSLVAAAAWMDTRPDSTAKEARFACRARLPDGNELTWQPVSSPARSYLLLRRAVHVIPVALRPAADTRHRSPPLTAPGFELRAEGLISGSGEDIVSRQRLGFNGQIGTAREERLHFDRMRATAGKQREGEYRHHR